MKFEIVSIFYEWKSDHEDVELYKKLLLKLPFISYNEDTNKMIAIIDTIEELDSINNIAEMVSDHSKEYYIFTDPDLVIDFQNSTIYIRDFYME